MMNFVKEQKLEIMELGELAWIPSLQEMDKWEIKYDELVQAPGDVIITGFDTIHWVVAPVSILFFSMIYICRMVEPLLHGI